MLNWFGPCFTYVSRPLQLKWPHTFWIRINFDSWEISLQLIKLWIHFSNALYELKMIFSSGKVSTEWWGGRGTICVNLMYRASLFREYNYTPDFPKLEFLIARPYCRSREIRKFDQISSRGCLLYGICPANFIHPGEYGVNWLRDMGELKTFSQAVLF